MTPTFLSLSALLACTTPSETPLPTGAPTSEDASQNAAPTPPSTPLADALRDRKDGWAKKADPDTKASYDNAITALEASGILTAAKQVGDPAPDFTLPNAQGGKSTLSELLKSGPVVLLWYRGGWCPYCNLTLHAYQEALPELKAAGATLVAITPETPDKSLSTSEKNELSFEVLSDADNAVARDYGVLFEVPADVWTTYESKLKVNTYYTHGRPELPLAATYVIAPSGEISWTFLSADYRERAEPSDVLQAVKAAAAPSN